MLLVNRNSGRRVPNVRSRRTLWRKSGLHVPGSDTTPPKHPKTSPWRSPNLHPSLKVKPGASEPLNHISTDGSESSTLPETRKKHDLPPAVSPPVVSKPGKPRKKRRFSLIILAGLAIFASILWVQRYPIIENYARSKLAEQGITGDLSLRYISKSHAVIDAIHLQSEAGPFFSAKTVEVEYDWQNALKGHVNHISVSAPELSIAFDQNGSIVSDWFPKSNSNSTSRFHFPRDGISIDNGKLVLRTPFGEYQTHVDAVTHSPQDMTATLSATPQLLTFREAASIIGGKVDVKVEGQKITYDAQIDVPSSTINSYQAKGVKASWAAISNRSDILDSLTSKIDITFNQIGSNDLIIENGKLFWDGTLKRPAAGSNLPLADGAWQADFKSASITNDTRRERLSKSVTLSDMMMNISASAPFSPGLTSVVDKLLSQNHMEASGRIESDLNGVTLSLDHSVAVRGLENTLILDQPTEIPFFRYDVEDETLTVAFNGQLQGPFATNFQNGKLVAKIENGQYFSNVISFASNFQTQQTWNARTVEGRPARLAPMKARISYDASQPTRQVRLAGFVDYDGDVPGGYATGVKATGILSLGLRDGNLTANFTPTRQTPINIKRLETTSEWIVHDARFNLSHAGPQYQRSGTSRIDAIVTDAQARLAHRTDPRDFTLKLDTATVAGELLPAEQNWTIQSQNSHITSETFPSPGTDVKANDATLAVTLKPGTPIFFTVESPAADIKTSLVAASNMSIKASGTPNTYAVNYGHHTENGPGIVTFAAGQLPTLPVSGDATYQESTWEGRAVTTLPKSNKVPINIAYRFAESIGTANVVINDLAFSPSMLQPQQLVPALSGKISRVEGLVSANIDLTFGVEQPLKSSGTATIKNLSAATLPGPFTGLNGELKFSSFFPLQTAGPQSMTLDSFDPGFPLENGKLEFEIIPDGVKIQSAVWPIGTGSISLDPTSWLYSATQNRFRLRIDNVSLGEFLKNVGGGNLYATGDVKGELPVLIEGVKVHVENGRLAVENGGIIEYTSPQTEAAASGNEYAGYAFDALKHFEYDELEALLNGPLDGPMKLRMKFNGSNPDVLYGTEFKFNVGVEGELVNILRSFQMGDAIGAKILEDIQARQNSSTAETQ